MYLYFWLIKYTVRRGSITFVETNLFFVIFRQKVKIFFLGKIPRESKE